MSVVLQLVGEPKSKCVVSGIMEAKNAPGTEFPDGNCAWGYYKNSAPHVHVTVERKCFPLLHQCVGPALAHVGICVRKLCGRDVFPPPRTLVPRLVHGGVRRAALRVPVLGMQ